MYLSTFSKWENLYFYLVLVSAAWLSDISSNFVSNTHCFLSKNKGKKKNFNVPLPEINESVFPLQSGLFSTILKCLESINQIFVYVQSPLNWNVVLTLSVK